MKVGACLVQETPRELWLISKDPLNGGKTLDCHALVELWNNVAKGMLKIRSGAPLAFNHVTVKCSA